MTKSLVSRPNLAFRVGVTGARALDDAAVAALRLQVQQVLNAVKAQVTALATHAACRAMYDQATPIPDLHLLSPLAEGADRLVAEEALALGFMLSAPLPFSREEYETDFPASTAAFRALLDQAGPRVLELDGARGLDEARSYEAAGRLVVRNCDLLIAIFDGGPGRGRGGTAEIARYASRFGPPVWWLRADGTGQPTWVNEMRCLLHPELTPTGAEADAALTHYLERSILPPVPAPRHSHGVISHTALALHARLRQPLSPLNSFLAETPRPPSFIWTFHKRLIAWAAGPRPAASGKSMSEPADTYWNLIYKPADALAVAYADRYRSSYVLVFGLAALALICAALGVAAHAWPLTLVELLVLCGIFCVVAANERGHWQERLISYRLLAELCRKQQALALLGWSLPMAEATRALRSGSDAAESPAWEDWVGWYFNAMRRAGPLPTGSFNLARCSLVRQELLDGLVAGQAEYHLERARTHHAAAQFFGRWGERFFLGTTGFVLVELLVLLFKHDWHEVLTPLGLITVSLPALSAAFVGIRSYAELETVGEQSERMCGVMQRAALRMNMQPLGTPLSSQELGAEAFDLADDMMRDLTGWTQLFRVKALEAG